MMMMFKGTTEASEVMQTVQKAQEDWRLAIQPLSQKLRDLTQEEVRELERNGNVCLDGFGWKQLRVRVDEGGAGGKLDTSKIMRCRFGGRKTCIVISSDFAGSPRLPPRTRWAACWTLRFDHH